MPVAAAALICPSHMGAVAASTALSVVAIASRLDSDARTHRTYAVRRSCARLLDEGDDGEILFQPQTVYNSRFTGSNYVFKKAHVFVHSFTVTLQRIEDAFRSIEDTFHSIEDKFNRIAYRSTFSQHRSDCF